MFGSSRGVHLVYETLPPLLVLVLVVLLLPTAKGVRFARGWDRSSALVFLGSCNGANTEQVRNKFRVRCFRRYLGREKEPSENTMFGL